MYNENEYNTMEKFDKADIFLRPLSTTVILLKAMHVNPLNFDWLEEPDIAPLVAATEEFNWLEPWTNDKIELLMCELQIYPGSAHMLCYACFKELAMPSQRQLSDKLLTKLRKGSQVMEEIL